MKAEQQRLPRFAVLIDADNTSPRIVDGLHAAGFDLVTLDELL